MLLHVGQTFLIGRDSTRKGEVDKVVQRPVAAIKVQPGDVMAFLHCRYCIQPSGWRPHPATARPVNFSMKSPPFAIEPRYSSAQKADHLIEQVSGNEMPIPDIIEAGRVLARFSPTLTNSHLRRELGDLS